MGPDFLAHFSRLDKLGGENGGLTGAPHIVTKAPAPPRIMCPPYLTMWCRVYKIEYIQCTMYNRNNIYRCTIPIVL